jgi:HD-like signal output (HDOD) protein
MAALLRNIGVLVVRQFFPDEFDAILDKIDQENMDFRRACHEVLGMNQREVGYLITVRWNLPETIVFAIGESCGSFADTGKILTIRKAIDTADAILAEKRFTGWDPHYRANESGSKGRNANMDLLFTQAVKEVEHIYTKLWG